MRIAPEADHPPRRRGVSLTPMIDVVFLLLVFFMLASRFGISGALPISPVRGAAAWEGAPRLVEVFPADTRLNGLPVAGGALAGRLSALMPTPDSPVILRARGGADVGRVVAVIAELRAAGFSRLMLVD